MTRETARFLLDLLNAQKLNVGAPDFPETVALVRQAQDELAAQLAGDETPPVDGDPPAAPVG